LPNASIMPLSPALSMPAGTAGATVCQPSTSWTVDAGLPFTTSVMRRTSSDLRRSHTLCVAAACGPVSGVSHGA
jgi:hypothetical protein